jgi:hypothetical protein
MRARRNDPGRGLARSRSTIPCWPSARWAGCVRARVHNWRVLLGVAAGGEFLDLDDSWPLFVAALTAEGVDAEAAAWDDASVDWGRYDLVTVMY